MIEVRNLVKKYGDYVAVNNLSFTVEKGEILGFLGPNGAGKSTTMNMITGYISANEGTVTINGHDIFEEPEEAKKHIGYLPELPPVYPDMTVREYLSFVADLKKVPKKEKDKAIQLVMRKTGITDYSERLIKHMSKGYRQRVGLAQAILGDPDLIILDEPTVGLDPKQIIEIRDLIKNLSKNHAVILSSHILAEISAVCDKVMIINQGHLIVSDTPDNLSNHIKGSNSLHIVVKGEKEVIHQALASIPDITKLEYKKDKEANCYSVNAYCNADADIREKVFYACAKAECPILDMNSSKMSLEDIFLKVTNESSKPAGKKKNAFLDRLTTANNQSQEQSKSNEKEEK